MSIVDEVFSQGIEAYQARDFAAAERAFQEVLQHEPFASEALLNLGNVCYQQGRTHEAETLWVKTLNMNPVEDKAYLNLGNLFYGQQDYKKAVDYWRIYQKLHPSHSDVHLNLGMAFEAMYYLLDAYKYYNRYLSLEKRGPSCAQLKQRMLEAERVAGHNLRQAEAHMKRGNLEKAQEAYAACVTLIPLHPKFYQHYGSVLYRLNELDEAAFWFEQAVLQSPQDSGLLVNLGAIYEKNADRFQAVWAYFSAIKGKGIVSNRVKEKFTSLWQQEGMQLLDQATHQIQALMDKHDFYDAEILAERVFDVAFQTDPKRVPQIKSLQEILEDRKTPKKAAANHAFVLAEEFYQNGEYEKAMRFYERYLVLQPLGPKAQEVQSRQEAVREAINAVVGKLTSRSHSNVA